jgi:signal transduction histidine kinase
MIIYLLLTKYLFNLSTQVIDLSKIEKELEREKQLRSSISKLTHELKNPIAVCNGYLEMLDINDQQKTKKYIDIITSEITRSKTIIDEFSSFGKLKNIDVDELDITYLLEDTITLLKPLFKQNKGKIIFSSKEEIYIKGDYNKLKQVFINLLKNTIEAKKEYENLIVEIKIKKENKQIILTIKDNGIGMDKATLKKVSEVFFTTKQNGTGIGLAFSKEVIELHKGQLLINSKLNEGTEVKIIFPNEKVRRL